jgi:prepilin-type processing-associated H-X9-DG protein
MTTQPPKPGTPGPDAPSAVERLRARTTARRRADELLAGTGARLRIREHVSELVIDNPDNPDTGRVHIAYADGSAAWERPIWAYWGCLVGYEDPEDPARKPVDARQIITALTTDPP